MIIYHAVICFVNNFHFILAWTPYHDQADVGSDDFSLNVTQQEFLVKQYGTVSKGRARVDVSQQMLNNNFLRETQKFNMPKLRDRISSFLSGRSAKKKIFKHQWNTELMTQAQLVEAIDKIAVDSLDDHLLLKFL